MQGESAEAYNTRLDLAARAAELPSSILGRAHIFLGSTESKITLTGSCRSLSKKAWTLRNAHL